jgi:hypothetical protein
MKSFISRLFGKAPEEEPGPELLSYPEIPRKIDTKEIEVISELRLKTDPVRSRIIASVQDLRDDVHALESMTSAGTIPPKLQKVTEHSLPAFIKSMEIALDRHFSDDIEEFYAQTADLIRSAAKNLQGKGKYLKLVYPDQMKQIRSTMGAIGRDLNEMTEAMKDATGTMASIRDARNEYDRLRQDIEEYHAKKQAWDQIWQQISQDEDLLGRIDEEIASIEDTPEFGVMRDIERAIIDKEREKKAIREEFYRIGGAASSVFRKAEHEAEKAQNTRDAQDMAKVRKWFHQPDPEEKRDIMDLLERAVPAVIRMAEAGEIPLKNKEEKHLFSGEKVLIEEVGSICSRFYEIGDDLREAQLEIAISGIMQKREALDRKRKKIREKHSDDTARLTQFEGELDTIREQLPAREKRLSKLLSALSGKETVVEIPDPSLPVQSS